MRKKLLSLVALVFASTAFAAPAAPKLVVLLVIDQFRADYLTRYESEFRPGGFLQLMKQGAYYPLAEYQILQSMTCPGHATISTGAYPYQMRIPTNDWIDASSGERVYCVEDRTHHRVGAPQPDPHWGTSPKNLGASTFGDELKNAGYDSKVVTVALKDRAAILMGGHRADLAVWMDDASLHWISSDYYLPSKKLPAWMDALNQAQDEARESLRSHANPANHAASELFSGWKQELQGPKPEEIRKGARAMMATAWGTDVTESAAEAAIREFKLGTHRNTDFLAVSFSSHDIMGHAKGPNSAEMKRMTLDEDRIIARLLAYLQKAVPGGKRSILVALTGDHGVAPGPEDSVQGGFEAGRISEEAISRKINERLDRKFGSTKGAGWITFATDLGFFLNHALISKKDLKLSEVEAEAKAVIEAEPGFAFVFSSSDYEMRKLPPGMFNDQILRTYVPGVSADLIGIPKPFYISEGDPFNHQTGYSYDRYVPLILFGNGIRAGQYANHAAVVDLAPTLSYLSGVVPPSSAEGRVLSEALAAQP